MKIELDQVSKFYELEESGIRRDVLKDISLTILQGDAISIIGPSGSGKSTLLNLAGTLDKPSSGSIRLDGQDTGSMNDASLATFRNQHIGFVFQSHHLLPQLTLLENVLLPVVPLKSKKKMKEASVRAMDLLKLVGLEDKIHQRPGQMSVGECQRGAVVRALINEPELILADEPTGSLDRAAADQLGDLLAEIHKKQHVTMVLVTHSHDLARQMDKIYRLQDGQLMEHTL